MAHDLPAFDADAASFRYDQWHGCWHLERTGAVPHFPFGFGLAYTTFELEDVAVQVEGSVVVARGQVRNTGDRPGRDVVQVYAQLPDPDASARLLGFVRATVPAGSVGPFEVRAPLGLLARRVPESRSWSPLEGDHVIRVGRHACRPQRHLGAGAARTRTSDGVAAPGRLSKPLALMASSSSSVLPGLTRNCAPASTLAFTCSPVRRVPTPHAGEGDELPLAGRQRLASLVHLRVEALRQSCHDARQTHGGNCSSYLLVGRGRTAERDVVAKRPREQEGLLRHQAQLASQRAELLWLSTTWKPDGRRSATTATRCSWPTTATTGPRPA